MDSVNSDVIGVVVFKKGRHCIPSFHEACALPITGPSVFTKLRGKILGEDWYQMEKARVLGPLLVRTAHLSIIEALSSVEEWAGLLEKPLPSRTPKMFFERLITCGGSKLLSHVSTKRDIILICCDLPLESSPSIFQAK